MEVQIYWPDEEKSGSKCMRPDVDYECSLFVRRQEEVLVTGADLLVSLCICKIVLRDRLTEYEGGLVAFQFFPLRKI